MNVLWYSALGKHFSDTKNIAAAKSLQWAWGVCRSAQLRKISPRTKLDYIRKYRQMSRSRTSPKDNNNCANSYYAARAAWSFGITGELLNCLKAAKRAHNRRHWGGLKQNFDRIAELKVDFDKYPRDPQRQMLQRARAEEVVGEFQQIKHETRRSTRPSKRAGLNTLGAQWRERVIQEAERHGSPHVLPICVLAACGCRPCEVEKGVEVTALADGRVRLGVKGAKVKEGISGQPWRAVEVDSKMPGVDRLHAACAARPDRTLEVQVKSVRGLEAAVSKFGLRVHPTGYRISTYSFRHQFASDAKAAGVAVEDYATALGHRVDRTSQSYGQFRYGRGRMRLKARGAVEIKKTRSDPAAIGSPRVKARPKA